MRDSSGTPDEGPGPSLREDSHAGQRSREASPARSTRRRAASTTPAAARGAAHANGDAAESGGGRWPRRQGSRSAGRRNVQDENSEEEGEEEGVGGWVGGRRRKGRQRSLEELHRLGDAGGASQQQQGESAAHDVADAHRRTGSGIRFKFTRNGVSL